MKKEHEALLLKETYELVELPAGCDAVSTQWVL